MVEITCCACLSEEGQYLIAICHNTSANMVKLKLLSAQVENITHANIQIIRSSLKSEEPADIIIADCLLEAVSFLNGREGSIQELIYFGDVNLSKPGGEEYPPLLMNQKLFASQVKNPFTACKLIKRILVSADQKIVDNAQKEVVLLDFNQPLNYDQIDLPPVIDNFLSKDAKLYIPVHLTDRRFIDSLMNYHQEMNDYEHRDYDFKSYIHRIQNNLEFIFGDKGQPLTFDFMKELKINFGEKSVAYEAITDHKMSPNKATLLSFATSYLMPPPIKNKLLNQGDLAYRQYSVISVGQFDHEQLGTFFMELILDQAPLFAECLETLTQINHVSSELLKKLVLFKSNQESLLDFTINFYDLVKITGDTEITDAVDEMMRNLECLIVLLENKPQQIRQLQEKFEDFSLSVFGFTEEQSRKKVLSYTFFSDSSDSAKETTLTNDGRDLNNSIDFFEFI